MPKDDGVICSLCEQSIARNHKVPSGILWEMGSPDGQLKTSLCRICSCCGLFIKMKGQGVLEWEPGRIRRFRSEAGPFQSQIQLSPSMDDLTNSALLWIEGGLESNASESKCWWIDDLRHTALFRPGFWTEPYKIQPLITDFSWMQNAITDCHEHHPNCSETAPTPFVPGLRVIDCLAKCSPPSIILAPDSCRYVALSYVWGPAHITDDEIAAAIKDAMNVTLKLGLQYLWVDRYCIPQDGEEKHRFIHVMDEIYSNAYLTIIGAAGTSARDGLPGVGDVSRVAQVEVEADGCTFLEVLRTPDAILSSTWATRAWTYQEGLLSKRSLIFTERGVLYRCASTCIDESIQRLIPRARHGYVRHEVLPSLFRTNLASGALTHLRGQIKQYTQRQLTYPQDSLNAFLGVLRNFGRLEEPIEHIWGVPYRAGTPELGWCHKNPAARRPDFPSWSWAGWAGVVEWADVPIETYLEAHRNSTFNFTFSPISVEFPVQSPSLSLPRWSFDHPKHIYVTGAIIPLHFNNHLYHHPDAYSFQAWARRPCAQFELFKGIFASISSFPDSEAEFGNDVVGLLATHTFGQKLKIDNIIILKPVGNDFERVGCVNMEDFTNRHKHVYTDDDGTLTARHAMPRRKADIKKIPWLRRAKRQRICLK